MRDKNEINISLKQKSNKIESYFSFYGYLKWENGIKAFTSACEITQISDIQKCFKCLVICSQRFACYLFLKTTATNTAKEEYLAEEVRRF